MSNPEQEKKDQQGNTNLLSKLRVSGKIIEFKSEGEEKLVCPYCGSTTFIFDYENGQVICAKCGSVVLEHVIDLRPEWRAFTAEEKESRARAGGPLNRLTSEALTTTIDWATKDASGKELDIKRKLEILKYRKWQQRVRVQTSYERNVIQAMNELSRISSQLGIPKACVDEAMGVYEQVLTKGLVRGRSVEAIVAACLHMACRKIGMPRSLDEISQYTRASRKEVARCFRLIARELGVRLPLSDPKLYVPRIVEQLKLSGEILKEALNILEQAKKRGLTAGKDPAGLAAAAVYIASLLRGEVRTQKEVAMAAQVTEVTVRNRYKELARELNIKIPIK
ncbi:transcription initiation factor IIB [Vulcanisaeta souniana]|uniref:Transcription initiation factor IIB n=1 Tax=Vulcanisaeta souniana JCM 11219 TaxID=1293586 RepID=A0A830DY68_9CREN|nr:transcription initiation factor IIB [Vulcanisaeta souniana]BDR92061.1 transcription initiation factor IIB [Vulcanisaeta souniana JCM 11219]GGI68182.1 transcription initiation factor IIB [Vulcanisaeta souniana JCM 11219]